MAVSIEEVYRSKRNDTNTATIILAKLMCDTASDLPSQSGLTGYILEQGCKADVISENKTYKIDSAGNWHVSGGEMWQNVYTESEIDSMMLTKQDSLTATQLDAVNSGITAAILQELQSYHTINSISSNSNVNDYYDRGIYTVGSASVAASITNTPFTSAGYVLFVLPSYQVIGSTRGKIQIAMTRISNVTNVKLRWYAYNSGTWSWVAWETVLP